MNTESKVPGSPKDKERQLTAIKYMLITLRLSHARIAKELGLCAHTVGSIVKKHNLKQKAKEAKAKGLKHSERYDDSLTAFIVNVKMHHKEAYHDIIEPLYKKHLNTL